MDIIKYTYNFKLLLFFMIFSLLKHPVISFKYFKAYNILSNDTISNDILIISDEGIIKYNIELDIENLIVPLTIENPSASIQFVTSNQFSSEDGGYIICRINEYIYLLSANASISYGNITISELNGQFIDLIPYIMSDSKKSFIICFINNQREVVSILHEVNIPQFEESQIISYKAQKIEYEEGKIVGITLMGIGCKIIDIESKQNIFTCFVTSNDNYMNAISMEQENDFNVIEVNRNYIDLISSLITVENGPNKINSLICLGENTIFKCVKYNSILKEWSNITITFNDCQFFQYNRGLKYINGEYLVYSYNSYQKVNYIKLDEDYKIKQSSENGDVVCTVNIQNCWTMYSSIFLYNKNENKYSLLTRCGFEGDKFRMININDECKLTVKEINSTIQANLSTSLTTIHESTSAPKTPLPSTIINTSSSNICIDNLNGIDFYEKGEIIKGKTNQTKEEINLDSIIKVIEIGKKYEIDGDDYNIRISPVDLIDTFNSTYVEINICDQILRKHYNLSKDDIITILQIEIDKLDEKALTNQVEYEIYGPDKKKLNLSYCKDAKIKVNYEIVNPSLINKTMVSHYSNIGVDIFDHKHSFFNDICFPYGNKDSDIILKDRVVEIFQNFSLCDNGCDYDQIDIDSMTVICSCQVKTEINVEVAEPVFKNIIEDAFKDSNFGVLLCYNLVFSLDYKTKNIGFWVSLLFIIINIILIILYSIYGIESIKIYVYQEMRKNNYIIKIDASPPLKKNKRKKSSNINVKFKNNLGEIYISSSNNNLKDNKTKLFLTEYNVTIPTSTKAKKKKKGKMMMRSIKIFSSKSANYSKYFKNESKMSSSNSGKRLSQNNKHIITYGLDGSLYINNRYSHKDEIEENENSKKCPGYYNLIQISSKNEQHNNPPNSLYILDNYDFESAIKYEKRHFWRILYICFLSYENILNTFFFKAPLETQSLRLILLFFSYICDMALNALFYLNQNLSDRYHYNGHNLYLFTLINNMTISVSSTLFSYLLVKGLNFLNNSKDSIESLFRYHEKIMRKNKKYKVSNDDIIQIYENLSRIYKILKIKIILYIMSEFLLALFFFYYITAFCEVYKNTQISWLSDSLISFLMSILVEIVMSFLVASFYMISVKYRFKALYGVSMFFYSLG